MTVDDLHAHGSCLEQVLAGLGLPGSKPKDQPLSQPGSELPSTAASEGYTSAGDPMHLTSSGKLIPDSPNKMPF